MDANVNGIHRVLKGVLFDGGATIMSAENKEHWMRLCELASKEQDPNRLMELVREITRLLEIREQALKSGRSGPDGEFRSN
jgi:hypothetical protein